MPGRDGIANRAKAETTMQEIVQSRDQRKLIESPPQHTTQQTRDVRAIIVGERRRKEFGDLPALARSISARGGLIHPIAITPGNKLIAGERRLRAWQLPDCRFNDQPIPVTVVDIDSIVAGEHDENDPELRKPFTPSEAVAIARALRPRIEAEARERQRQGGELKASGNLPEAEKGETREKLARAVGAGARTLDKATAIVEAAEQDPEKFGRLVDAMDRTGRVNGPFKRLQNIIAADAIKNEAPGLPMQGPYFAGIVDWPWAAEPENADKDHGSRGYYPYPTMVAERAADFDVPAILKPNASVYLWIPNYHLLRGDHLTIAKAWSLRPVALLTWVKEKLGQGQRARGTTEHLIQMIRGEVLSLGFDTRTDFRGAGGAHSQKPIEAYALVEKLSPSPRYFELFSRSAARASWDMHGNEVGKFAESPAACDNAGDTGAAHDSPVQIPKFLPVRPQPRGEG